MTFRTVVENLKIGETAPPSTRAANIRKSTAASQATNTRKSSMPRLSWGSRRALCRKKAARKKNTRRRLSCRGFDIYIRKNPFWCFSMNQKKGIDKLTFYRYPLNYLVHWMIPLSLNFSFIQFWFLFQQFLNRSILFFSFFTYLSLF